MILLESFGSMIMSSTEELIYSQIKDKRIGSELSQVQIIRCAELLQEMKQSTISPCPKTECPTEEFADGPEAMAKSPEQGKKGYHFFYNYDCESYYKYDCIFF
jgi:hypothetical protein